MGGKAEKMKLWEDEMEGEFQDVGKEKEGGV